MKTDINPPLRPFRPVKPGEILQEELEAREWTQTDLAEVIDRPVQAVNEIIAGKKAITPDTALALSQALGTSPEYWLNLESAYRLDLLHERRSSGSEISRRSRLYSIAPMKELMKRHWIDVSTPTDLDRLEQEVCRFLKIPSPGETPRIPFAARAVHREGSFSTTQIAWACRVQEVATQVRAKAFSAQRVEEQIRILPRLSISNEETRKLQDILADLGIRFVIVEHLPNSRIDGAALWLDDHSPVVAVSLRYDRVDWFWFTLMHELAHIVRGDAKLHAWMFDDALVGKDAEPTKSKSEREAKADKMAGEWLIPQRTLEDFARRTRPYFSRTAILHFSAEVSVHPGIIVGRLQHMGEVPWTHHRNLLSGIRHVFAKGGETVP
jgi:HTH-type transcriptional regulator / antitoxin HigA